MPTYEYECPTCGTYDLEQRITAPALEACPKCGAPVRRLISRSNFALRGGGWYRDGYGAGGPAKGPGSGSGNSSSSSAGAGTAASAGGESLQKVG